MNRWILLIISITLLLSGCGGNTVEQKEPTFQEISQEEAKRMMDSEDVLILDVREPDEFAGGHIPGAVQLSVYFITEETAKAVIPDLDTVVLVYCRSGNRSITASEKLVKLGYTNIYEFGGINTWPYEVQQS